jgi:hypothetical protein
MGKRVTRLRYNLVITFALMLCGKAAIAGWLGRGSSQHDGTTASHPAAAEAKAAMSFAPFDQWKAAVLAGDNAALAKNYSTNPPAQTRIGRDMMADPAEEPRFWSNFGRSSLVKFNPKILAISHPQPGSTELVLRVEAEVRPPVPQNDSAAPKNPMPAGVENIVASMSQLWTQQADGWRIIATQRSNFVTNAPFRLPQPVKPDTQLYPQPSEAQKDLDAALAVAGREHKRVLVVFGANWCYDCHVLNSTFTSREFAPLVKANYEVVHVNIGDEGTDNLDLGKRLGVGLERGIPSLAVLDPDGKVVYAQKNGEFESARKIGPADVRDFLERWKPTTSRPSTPKPVG